MAKIALSTTEIDPGVNTFVLGSPLSGKTKTLIELVQSLEDAGAKPEEILVLTASRLAANDLRDRLAAQSKKASRGPRARSISSFAFALLAKNNPELKLFSGASQQALIASLIDRAISQKQNVTWGFDATTCQLQGFQNEVRDLLAVVVENQLGEKGLIELQKQFPKTKLQVAIDLIPGYQAAHLEQNALDPSELLIQALGALNNAEPYRFLLVDDAQDLSEAALALISALSKTGTSFIFGDPDAAVLGFRSSQQSFLARFDGFATINLTPDQTNPAKQALLQKVSGRIPTSLASKHRPRSDQPLETQAELFDNQSAEADWLAAELRRAKLIEKLDWTQMAVIARTRTQLDQLANDLSARNVPVRIVGVQQALRDQRAARSVLDFGALVYQLENQLDIEAILSSPLLNLDPLGQRRLFRELALRAENQGLSRSKILSEIFEELVESESFEIKALNRVIQARFQISAQGDISAHQFVSQVAELMNLERLKTLAKANGPVSLAASRDLDALLELFAAAQRFDLRQGGSAKDFVLNQLELSIPEDSLAPIGLRPAVTLATSAQLAGKSYELVALPRLQEGIWPNLKPRSSVLGASGLQAYLVGRSDSPEKAAGNELADELRAFYKAVGAHRSKLLLSAMEGQDEQPTQFFTMFGIVGKKNTEQIDFDIRRQVGRLRKRAIAGDKIAIATLAALSLAGVPGAHPRNWQGLQEISTSEPVVTNQEALRLSASKLEAFEKCPLHWFIGTFGGEGTSFQASLGTLMHAALEASSKGVDIGDFVQSNWYSLDFESKWVELAQLRKSARMIALMTEYLSGAGELIAAEKPFELQVGNLTVAGKIDRVEKSPEGLVVVDLKTGKPQTQQEVSDNRQLSLYQLSLMNSGEQVSGARIVSIGAPKLKVMDQPALEGERLADLTALLERAAAEIGSDHFAASFSSHCAEDGNCQLLLAKAVQHD